MNKYVYALMLITSVSSLSAEHVLDGLADKVQARPRPTMPLVQKPSSQTSSFIAPEMSECLSKGYSPDECRAQIAEKDRKQASEIYEQLDEATIFY